MTELQLKPHHYPCRLFKKWKEFLTLYTTCDFDQIHSGINTLGAIVNLYATVQGVCYGGGSKVGMYT